MNRKPLPRTSLEPVCLALGGVIRQRREASGWSLNRLAELSGLSTPVKWKYRAIYRVGDQQVGQWSQEMAITVGG